VRPVLGTRTAAYLWTTRSFSTEEASPKDLAVEPWFYCLEDRALLGFFLIQFCPMELATAGSEQTLSLLLRGSRVFSEQFTF